jgi:hypothetical protein
VESRGCDFCRDEQNLKSEHVQEVVSSSKAKGLLLQCPYCQCLYLDPADGMTRPYPIDSADAARWVGWDPEDVLLAVRSMLNSRRDDSGWTFERADLDGDEVLVIFRVEDESRYGVRYQLSEVPMGNNTGCLCATPDDWAAEIGLTMDEQVLTGGGRRAERISGSEDLTLLRWVW